MRYLITPTKRGWYLTVKNGWKNWSIRSGWFTLFELLWCFEIWKYQNPRYFSIEILGFNLEIGKFEKKTKK